MHGAVAVIPSLPKPPASVDAVLKTLKESTTGAFGDHSPPTFKAFRCMCDQLTSFLAFSRHLRRVIYMPNSIETLNYRLHQVIIPNDIAAVKLLWLAMCDIEEKRAQHWQGASPASGPADRRYDSDRRSWSTC